ncbi:MAG: hypothetical protein AAF788_02905 [Pseudomonadota bacterium]
MLRFLFSFVAVAAGALLLLNGILAPLTPKEGMPEMRDVLLYGAAPLALMALGILFTDKGVLRLLYTLVMVAAIFGLIYVGLMLVF